jgi:hypothetical protein
MVLLDLAAAGSSLDQPKIAAIPAISAIEQRARASIPAEILARGLSCVSATLQLKREWSLWPEFCWIPGNLCEFSKGYFAPTFLSSSPPTPATQSDLCGICPGCRIVCQTVGGLYSAASGLRSSRSRKRFSSPDTVSRKPPYSSISIRCVTGRLALQAP